MKYLLVIPMTLVFCLWLYFFMVTLPKQLRTTDVGNRVWPTIEQFAGLTFALIGGCVLIYPLVTIFAKRWGFSEFADWYINIFFAPVIIVATGFFLLLSLVIIMKTLQFFGIIR